MKSNDKIIKARRKRLSRKMKRLARSKKARTIKVLLIEISWADLTSDLLFPKNSVDLAKCLNEMARRGRPKVVSQKGETLKLVRAYVTDADEVWARAVPA